MLQVYGKFCCLGELNPLSMDLDVIMGMSNFSNDFPLNLCCLKYIGSLLMFVHVVISFSPTSIVSKEYLLE